MRVAQQDLAWLTANRDLGLGLSGRLVRGLKALETVGILRSSMNKVGRFLQNLVNVCTRKANSVSAWPMGVLFCRPKKCSFAIGIGTFRFPLRAGWKTAFPEMPICSNGP